ncbi:hypothetical protein ACFWXZ_14305 [[Kitasatospora] papulosa]|uniref:hypothetical protein n=1 Tax=[Kitasatospora] papulosa TaxID=1464011 RepID=UPI0036A0448D
MSTRARAIAYLTLAAGLAIVAAGLVTYSHSIRTAGLAVTVIGATAVAVTQQRKAALDAAHVSADQLADADRAGYLRCMEHVARGLLDTPPPTGTPCTAPTTATVHRLHIHPEHRKAQ